MSQRSEARRLRMYKDFLTKINGRAPPPTYYERFGKTVPFLKYLYRARFSAGKVDEV